MALGPEIRGKGLGLWLTEYDWKDIALYALAVGAGFHELDYCYESNMKVIPTFGVAVHFGAFFRAADIANVDKYMLLHGEHELMIHNPIPPAGNLNSEARIEHCYDLGADKGALIVVRLETVNIKRVKMLTNIMTLFCRNEGGFGGEKPPKSEFSFPDGAPDYTVDDCPALDQPLLYRLTGDDHKLHADEYFARKAGYDGPIMHGACTLGFSTRALIRKLTPGRPEYITRIKCRFSDALYPGKPIQTMIWKTGDASAKWKTIDVETGKVVIDRGIVEYTERPSPGTNPYFER